MEPLDFMLMTLISVAHEAITDDAAWAALVARYPGLDGRRETLHSMADLMGAMQRASMQEEPDAAQAGPFAGPAFTAAPWPPSYN